MVWSARDQMYTVVSWAIKGPQLFDLGNELLQQGAGSFPNLLRAPSCDSFRPLTTLQHYSSVVWCRIGG